MQPIRYHLVSSIITLPGFFVLVRFNSHVEPPLQKPPNVVVFQNAVGASYCLEGREAADLRLPSQPPPRLGASLGQRHDLGRVEPRNPPRHALRLPPAPVGDDEVHWPRVLGEEVFRQGTRALAGGEEEEGPPASVRRQASKVHSVVFTTVDVQLVVGQAMGGQGRRRGAA